MIGFWVSVYAVLMLALVNVGTQYVAERDGIDQVEAWRKLWDALKRILRGGSVLASRRTCPHTHTVDVRLCDWLPEDVRPGDNKVVARLCLDCSEQLEPAALPAPKRGLPKGPGPLPPIPAGALDRAYFPPQLSEDGRGVTYMTDGPDTKPDPTCKPFPLSRVFQMLHRGDTYEAGTTIVDFDGTKYDVTETFTVGQETPDCPDCDHVHVYCDDVHEPVQRKVVPTCRKHRPSPPPFEPDLDLILNSPPPSALEWLRERRESR